MVYCRRLGPYLSESSDFVTDSSGIMGRYVIIIFFLENNIGTHMVINFIFIDIDRMIMDTSEPLQSNFC
jgi:hypothetical protein